MIITMRVTKQDSMAYENKAKRKANRHKDEDRYVNHVA